MNKTAQAFALEFADITSLIDEAFMSLRQDAVPSLNDLGQRVEILCREVAQSEVPVIKEMQPLMASTIVKLDALALEIHSFQNRLKTPGDKSL